MRTLLPRGFLVSAAIALAVALAGAACGGDDEEPSPTPVSPRETATATATGTPSPTSTATPEPPPTAVFDGVEMSVEEFEERAKLTPVGVMIDNHPVADHAGLDKADLVFETFVEGQVTRYLAVYWRRDADYIEPVRSARTPFVMWAAELQAMIGHVGSSEYPGEADAPARMREWGVISLDQFRFGPPTYYRDTSRRAPHNMVTSTEGLRAAAAYSQLDPGTGIEGIESWQFKDGGEGTDSHPGVAAVDISFSTQVTSALAIRWEWEPESARYLRYLGGEPHRDSQSGEQLAFTNVVVMTVNPRSVSPHGHTVLDQLGEGPASVYLDGRRIDGTWQKPSVHERTRFYDPEGQEIAFNRGPTWLEAVGPSSVVTDTPAD